ncbi:DMT family transporter [Agaribacterium haliotis]|uniref:DMT family transporter n=1 Tax=Agaribacterium haliotis TaxID=2013869 RepID=UPI000BB575A2|nr:SMR family transporter [Agaribacterium haliotis]
MAYLWLTIAIIAEVVATNALKASEGFSKLGPSLLVIGGYALTFYCLSLVLKAIPVGLAYAIWAGLGMVLIAIVAAIVFDQKLDIAAVVGMAFIIVGVFIISVFSKAISH